jgi:predicted dehydrogenase
MIEKQNHTVFPRGERLAQQIDNIGGVHGWGIIGTGQIARNFAADLGLLTNAKLCGVLSRDTSTAEQFAAKYNAAKAYADIDAFLASKDIAVVYIASPNSAHVAQALRCIRAGKHVLIEKPAAPSEPEIGLVEREAERHGVFAMEAMWTRFLPGIAAVREALSDGLIGDVQAVRGTLSWKMPVDANNRFFSKSLGGGASLDLGVYLLSLTMHMFGEPEKISGRWKAAPTGVDMAARYKLHYPGMEADLLCGFDANLHNSFEITGTKGQIRVSDPFIRAERIEILTSTLARRIAAVFPSGKAAKVFARLPFPGHRVLIHPLGGNGLSAQAAAVMQAIDSGLLQHPVMPLGQSAAALRAIQMLLSHPAVDRV